MGVLNDLQMITNFDNVIYFYNTIPLAETLSSLTEAFSTYCHVFLGVRVTNNGF
jgi:hypothetical protein